MASNILGTKPDLAAIGHIAHEVNVQAPAHSFYALEACEFLGLGEAGAVRVGMAPYNTEAEVDRLLNRLGDLLSA